MTIERYLQRLAAFLAPASVTAAEGALRQFTWWLVTEAGLDSIAAVRRDDIEDYKRAVREFMPVLSLCDRVDVWRYGRSAGLAVLGWPGERAQAVPG